MLLTPFDLIQRWSPNLVQRLPGGLLAPPPPATPLPQAQPGMVLFCDFDGPVVDVSGRYYSTYRLALARTRKHYLALGQPLNLLPMAKRQFWRLKQVRIPDPEIALRSGLEGEQIDFFLAQVQDLVNCCPGLLRRDLPQAQVEAALQLLQRQQIKLVLVTLRCERQVAQFLQRYQLGSVFSAIYGTQDVQAAYQNYTDLKTKLLSQALEQHRGDGQVWMVGDTEADVVAAQRLGVSAIALTCGIRSAAYLKLLKPDALQPSLWAVAQGISEQLTQQG